MYKGTIASGTALTANTNIPLTTMRNSNWKTQYNPTDSTISVREQGYYNIFVSLPVTNASATPLTLQVYANDTPIATAVCEHGITATTGICTLTIVDCIKVAGAEYPNLAKLSLRLIGGTATTANVGKFIVEER